MKYNNIEKTGIPEENDKKRMPSCKWNFYFKSSYNTASVTIQVQLFLNILIYCLVGMNASKFVISGMHDYRKIT